MASTMGEGMVSKVPAPPIVVADINGVDLGVYYSIDAANKSLEAVDVRRGEYVAFDSLGRLLKIDTIAAETRIAGLPTITHEKVSLTLVEELPQHTEELRRRLINYLRAKEVRTKDLDAASLSDLLMHASEGGPR